MKEKISLKKYFYPTVTTPTTVPIYAHTGTLGTMLKLVYMMVTSKNTEITVLLLPTAFKVFLGLEEKHVNYWIFSVTFKQIHNTSGFLQLHRETKFCYLTSIKKYVCVLSLKKKQKKKEEKQSLQDILAGDK